VTELTSSRVALRRPHCLAQIPSIPVAIVENHFFTLSPNHRSRSSRSVELATTSRCQDEQSGSARCPSSALVEMGHWSTTYHRPHLYRSSWRWSSGPRSRQLLTTFRCHSGHFLVAKMVTPPVAYTTLEPAGPHTSRLCDSTPGKRYFAKSTDYRFQTNSPTKASGRDSRVQD
jgi:hypothetical protein